MNRKCLVNGVVLACTIGIIPVTALAAPAIPLPGDSITNNEVMPAEGFENTLPQSEGVDEGLRFTLTGITVEHEGMELADEELDNQLDYYVSQEIGAAELDEAVATVTNYARTHGYPAATAYIPAQTAIDRHLIIRIEPGRYGEVRVENNSKLDTNIAKGFLGGLKQDQVIKIHSLENALYNLRDIPGIKVAGILSPGEKQGTSDLTVRVADRKQYSFILYSENYGSKSAGRYRYGFQGDYYDTFGNGGKFTVGLLISNQKQHNYNLSYEMPVGHSATRIGIGFSHADYELGNVFRALGAEGKADTWSLYGRTPLWNTSTSSMSFVYGYNFRKITDELSKYNMTWDKHSHSVNLGFDGLVRGNGSSLTYNVGMTTGTMVPDSDSARAIGEEGGTTGRFTKGTFDMTGIYAFNHGLDVMLKLSGQKAANNLDSSEHLYLGGARGVRAYPQGEASGDEGILGTIELRYHTKLKGLTLSTYFDAGHVNIGRAGGEGNMTLKGWGIGVTYVRPNDWFLRFDYARRIGGDKLMSADAQSRQRMWFILGKIF